MLHIDRFRGSEAMMEHLTHSMNSALQVGFVRWLRGRPEAAWKRTTQVAEAGGALP